MHRHSRHHASFVVEEKSSLQDFSQAGDERVGNDDVSRFFWGRSCDSIFEHSSRAAVLYNHRISDLDPTLGAGPAAFDGDPFLPKAGARLASAAQS